jgi:hypothetical protein
MRPARLASGPTHPVRYIFFRMKFKTIENWREIIANLH